MNELIDTLTGWLPDTLEPYAEVLLYLGVLGVMSVVPVLLWLGWVARPRRSS